MRDSWKTSFQDRLGEYELDVPEAAAVAGHRVAWPWILAAAAAVGVGTGPRNAVRRGLQNLFDLSVCAVFPDVGDADPALFAADRVRHKDRAAVDPADAKALRGVVGDLSDRALSGFQHVSPPMFHVKQFYSL